MIRALALFAALAGLAVAAAWFADNPGAVAVDWRGWRLETSVPVLLAIAALLAALGWALLRAGRAIVGGPRAFLARRSARRQAKGARALTLGLNAIAAGDGSQARRLARQAGALLDGEPLTHLLAAQAAQLTGDDQTAEQHFSALLDAPETESLGLRGLMALARRQGDSSRAAALARQAYERAPDAPWVAANYIDLAIEDGDWDGAAEALTRALKQKVLDGVRDAERLASLHLARSTRARAEGDDQRADELALAAHKAAPDFVPAIVAAAGALARAGKRRRAASALAQGWALSPHPDLVAALDTLWPEMSPAERLKHIEHLTGKEDASFDGLIARAEAALDASLWGVARQKLGTAQAIRVTRHLCALMARLEDADGTPQAAQDWLRRAAVAAPDAVWQCESCGRRAATWTAQCPECGAFASARWAIPQDDPMITDQRA
jgi:HemY protein